MENKAKNKAEELVYWYDNLLTPLYNIDTNHFFRDRCIKCALICVEEIIKSSPTSPLKNNYNMCLSDIIDESVCFWEEVRDELNKMK
jgi:hypothetical protein